MVIRRATFFDHLAATKALLMLYVVTSISNSSKRNTAISSWYMLGFLMMLSSKALSMGGVILWGRPTPFGGALVVPKHRRFDRIDRIERVLQRATSAICRSRSDLLRIMSSISLC